MISVKNKWCLITGASRGIGLLTALFMAEKGCNLVLHSRKIESTLNVLNQVKAFGVDAYSVHAELSDQTDIVKMLDEIDIRETKIDIIFNNAAIQLPYQEAYWNTNIEDFVSSMQINLISIATICYRLIPKMIERGFGRVINTTSGIQNQPEQAGYSTSKAALDKFTIDLGSKLEGSNVLLNLTDPGWCRTDLGGPNAPNDPTSSLPGVVIGAFIDDTKSGRLFAAPNFHGMSLEEAVLKAESLS